MSIFARSAFFANQDSQFSGSFMARGIRNFANPPNPGFAGIANPANLDSRIREICLERESFLPLDSRFANPAANPMRIKR